MVILYDSLLTVLFFALLSFTITQLLYFRGENGYVVGTNAPAINLGWLGMLVVLLYWCTDGSTSVVYTIIFRGVLTILVIAVAIQYYQRLVRPKDGITLYAYLRKLVTIAFIACCYGIMHYNAYTLKNVLMISAMIGGLVLVMVQLKVEKNKSDPVWMVILAGSQLILGTSLILYHNGNAMAANLQQIIGCIVFAVGLALNFSDMGKRSNDQKILALEQQNRRLFEAEVQVLKYAYKDQITDLPNYSSFHSTLNSLLKSKTSSIAHLLYLDLDDFRRVNTVVGFAEGNDILRACGNVITSIIPGRDKLFRINGSRYALIHFGGVHSVQSLASEIIAVINDAEELRTNIYFKQGVSIGITEIEYNKDFNTIVNQAEIAMYKVKENRKNDFEYFNELHEQEYKNLLELEGKLKNATRENVWTIFLQPQIDVSTNEIKGLEALIRWFDGEKYILPNKFIPLAEKNGLIINIGDDVIKKVFGLMNECHRRIQCPMKFSINISAVEIFDESFVSRMEQYIEDFGIDPSHVTLELTETSILENVEEAQVILAQLRDMKLSISIDDFGSGYTSLYYLSKLPIDEVKIDKSFISNILSNEKDKIMLGYFTNLCHDLGLNVVAEGIETEEQLAFVKDIQCDLYQGYYFSKPMSCEDMYTVISENMGMKTS